MSNVLFSKPDELEGYIKKCYAMIKDKCELAIGYKIMFMVIITLIKCVGFALLFWICGEWILQGISPEAIAQADITMTENNKGTILPAVWIILMLQGVIYRNSMVSLVKLCSTIKPDKKTYLTRHQSPDNMLRGIILIVSGFILSSLLAYTLINTLDVNNAGLILCLAALPLDIVLIFKSLDRDRLFEVVSVAEYKAENFTLTAWELTAIKESGKFTDDMGGVTLTLEFQEEILNMDSKELSITEEIPAK